MVNTLFIYQITLNFMFQTITSDQFICLCCLDVVRAVLIKYIQQIVIVILFKATILLNFYQSFIFRHRIRLFHG